MLPSPAEVAAARRALKAIHNRGHPSRADALTLRLWSGPRNPLRPLADIAYEIVKEASKSREQSTQS
jgi:hypothetical protein